MPSHVPPSTASAALRAARRRGERRRPRPRRAPAMARGATSSAAPAGNRRFSRREKGRSPPPSRSRSERRARACGANAERIGASWRRRLDECASRGPSDRAPASDRAAGSRRRARAAAERQRASAALGADALRSPNHASNACARISSSPTPSRLLSAVPSANVDAPAAAIAWSSAPRGRARTARRAVSASPRRRRRRTSPPSRQPGA